jgi:hypothetical protein
MIVQFQTAILSTAKQLLVQRDRSWSEFFFDQGRGNRLVEFGAEAVSGDFVDVEHGSLAVLHEQIMRHDDFLSVETRTAPPMTEAQFRLGLWGSEPGCACRQAGSFGSGLDEQDAGIIALVVGHRPEQRAVIKLEADGLAEPIELFTLHLSKDCSPCCWHEVLPQLPMQKPSAFWPSLRTKQP